MSGARIVEELRTATKKGDRAALVLAVDQMRTLALSPRYWAKYLALLRNPLARLVDLLVIKQGDRVAHQKGWKKLGGELSSEGASAAPSETSPRQGRRRRSRRSKRRSPRRGGATTSPEQPTLFDL
ncbi:MAG: hypothetical protein HY728_07915 [Candidatus Rokubacteria bacterium]|nr:hypothetical protein [Candidatus Rokubacteria bacterium]